MLIDKLTSRVILKISDLNRIRQDARAALLTSKRTIDSQHKIQRDQLFASSAVTEKQNENEKVTSVINLFTVCVYVLMQ